MVEPKGAAAVREWVVLMRARSSIRFRGDPRLVLTTTPRSTAPVTAVRLRNAYSTLDGQLLVTGLFVEARGEADGPESAVKTLAGWAAQHLQVIATAANGAVDEPADVLAYAPPTASEEGRFVERRSCGTAYPASVVRSIDAEDLLAVLERLLDHPDQERLQRAMAHYRQALQVIDPFPFNRVYCGESLFVACENLMHVILRRLYREAGLPDSGDSKHKLAVAPGFEPPNKGSSRHLSDFDSSVRAKHIFDDDDAAYKKLKFASDHFEHGSRSFDKVQIAAEASADRAFGYIRRAILREIGVPPHSPLFSNKYNEPQGGWQPTVQ